MKKLPFVKMRAWHDIITCPDCKGTGRVKDGLGEKPCCNPLCCLGMALTARGHAKMKNLLKEGGKSMINETIPIPIIKADEAVDSEIDKFFASQPQPKTVKMVRADGKSTKRGGE